MARKKSKKFKGFKVAEKAHYFFGKDSDGKIIRQMYQCKKSLEKCEKITKIPSKNVIGEYCPKQSGCCWDYAKKKEEEKHAT